MYASLSTSHWPLAADPHIETHINGGTQADTVSISCHLSNHLYVSFQPSEARTFAEKLLKIADDAEAMQLRIDAAMGRLEEDPNEGIEAPIGPLNPEQDRALTREAW